MNEVDLDRLRISAEWGDAVAPFVGQILDWFETTGDPYEIPGVLYGWLDDIQKVIEHLEIDAEERQWLLRRDILTEFEQAIFRSDLVVGDDNRKRLNSLKARVLGDRP